MLTIELRTMDMDEVIELWETDKQKLKIKLLDDYEDLVKEYREQTKIYTQESTQGSEIFLKYRTFTKINYQLELDIDERIRGTIKFTNDFKENIKIALEVNEGMRHERLATRSLQLKEIISLKAHEIEKTLKLLVVKVKYDKDFSLKADEWLHEDLLELRIQKIEDNKDSNDEN